MLRREGHIVSGGEHRGALIARLGAGVLGFAALLAVFTAPAPALNSVDPLAKAPAGAQSAAAPRVTARDGLESYRAYDANASIDALRAAADGGEPLAAWRLARIYADGDGVARDDRKAFDYFSRSSSASPMTTRARASASWSRTLSSRSALI